jgi:hypothetical protein
VAAGASGKDFFVSPTGDDANDGSQQRPFATITHAMQAVRKLDLARNPGEPVNVVLRGGLHRLHEKLVFGPEDSGTAKRPVTYRSYPGERAVISGGRKLAGTWRQSPGKPYWQLDIPAVRDQGWRFFSLYADNQSRTRARYPNWDQKVLRAKGRAPGGDPRQSFAFFKGDINPDWSNLTDIDIVLLCSWTPTLHRIESVDGAQQTVTFHSSHTRTVDAWEKNFRYYLSNVFEALDDPGEWYLNYHTGTLYYYPKPGEDPNRMEFVAPVLKSQLIEFRGDLAAGKFVQYLRFQDLDIRHVDGDMDRYNGMYRQGHMYLTSAVVAHGLRHSSFEGCTLAQLGEYAMELADGCQDVKVQRCHIWDLGAGALQLGVTSLRALLTPRVEIGETDIALEAEQADLAAPMEIGKDKTASGGGYVLLPLGQEGGTATFTIQMAKAGDYEMLAQLIAPSGQSDSFTVQVNNGPVYTYDTGNGREWFTSKIKARELDNKALTASLVRGPNTIVIGGREAGAKLDRLILRPADSARETDALATNQALDLVIDNNCIHRLGTIWHGCYGIVNRFASRTKITHNEIYDTHWDAIGLDARWTWRGETYSHGNEIAYNNLHDLGLRYHTDAAGVYQFGPLDTHIHHNLVHDTRAYPYICGYAGIYLDEQSRGALVENNVVHDVEWVAYFQHKGMDNVFRNNIGGFARDGLIHRGGLNDHWKANYLEAYRNLYVTDNAIALKSKWKPGEKPPVLHDNMYYTTAPDTELTFAGESLAEWQAEGQDAGSIVGDPGFRDPARRDLSLRPNAPAIKAVGFVPFDQEMRKVGLYGDKAWRAIASHYPPRAPAPTWSADDLSKLIAFESNFDDMPVGYQPPFFHLATDGKGTFAVSDDAALSGTKSYKCTDLKGLRKSFYPYIHVAPRRMNNGTVSFSFAAMQPAEGGAPFYVEFRGKGSTSQVGPSLNFPTNGMVVANGTDVLQAEPGSWTKVTITFRLGQDAPKTYQLVLANGGKTARHTLPFKDETFDEVRWLGISASGDVDGVFYLDDMSLQYD